MWTSFLGPDGTFPSGKNHDDALNYVREKLVDIDESDEEVSSDSFEMEKYLADISVGVEKQVHYNNIRELAERKRKQVAELEEENIRRVKAATTTMHTPARRLQPPLGFINATFSRSSNSDQTLMTPVESVTNFEDDLSVEE